MKTSLLLFSILLFVNLAKATTTLRVQDPHKTWLSYQGNIDSATLSIKPKGAYFECALYLTFSSKPYNTAYNQYDTFEVQMPFELPEGAFITDSWLWVGNQIVQAVLIERGRAQMIYEGIVNRRQDPSILYKNSATQYELRVYPMPARMQRRVKITYMVPAKWNAGKASCPIPLNILKASTQVPDLEILSYTDANWNSPVIPEWPAVSFQPVPGELFNAATIGSSSVAASQLLTYSVATPMQNGVYSAVYPTTPTEGYYQFVMMPAQALNISGKKKTAFLFDHETSSSTTSLAMVIAQVKHVLQNNYTHGDSFNLFFSKLGVYAFSNTWLPCDSATVSQVFGQLTQQVTGTGYSNLPSLLNDGINFISNNNGGDIALFTNTDNFNTVASANQLINDVMAAMGANKITVHILDYQDQSLSYMWTGNTYYYGGEYLYSNLSALTGGNYESVRIRQTNYYYYTFRPFSETSDDLISQMQGRITGFGAHADMQSGFCYGALDNANTGNVFIGEPYIKIGKYSGSLPIEVEVSGMYNGTPLSQNFVINNPLMADSFTRKMWVAKYIAQLESGVNINNQTKAEIIDSSIQNRVLSIFTAFLALEPSDTTLVCTDCEDETNTTPTLSVSELENNINVKAFPNPFSTNVTIKIYLDKEDATLKVYNTMGQLVKTFDLPANMDAEVTLTWDGKTDTGDELAAGVYIAVLETKSGKKTLRILKS